MRKEEKNKNKKQPQQKNSKKRRIRMTRIGTRKLKPILRLRVR